ncbi:MAG: undecaprenyldiphospho-muramoylpentapeptide beta-N-acetylglucosaminyltransferase [Sediminibacterium sp.]|jgi:UDP-N-acetylglucosamine--N-acetylmuramyl-(pentapeptide) pyrophosphoryl-undecaprenol N-acetylglucosamine transferase
MKFNQHNQQLRIIIAGGGTGGHIFPAIAVAQAIQVIQPDAAILFVGATGKMEMEKVPQAGYEIKGLTIAGLNRSNMFKNLTLPFKLIKSFFQVRNIFNAFKPNAVFGVGGYSSFPVLKFAQSKGIPTFIHESNAFAGKSNIWLGKNATKIFTGTQGMEQFFPSDKIIVTGNPVRKNISASVYSKDAALMKFGLLPERKTVLIVGGSLGANSINDAIMQHLESFSNHSIQLIWQTGKSQASKYVNAAKSYSNVYVNSFLDDMSAAYTAADLIVSRAGAMSVAEIALTAKPCVFVPYPFAAEDHQSFNAKNLVDASAAFMIKDSKVKESLAPMILDAINQPNILQNMQEKIKAFAITDADKVIAEQIIKNTL